MFNQQITDSSKFELNKKIAAINFAFKEKLMRLWDHDSLSETKDGIQIKFSSSPPRIHFDSIIEVVNQLKISGVISHDFHITKEFLHSSTKDTLVNFIIPFTIPEKKEGLTEEKVIPITPNSHLLDAKLLTQGPLQKKVSTQLLDEIIRDISTPGSQYQFDINEEGLIVHFKDEKGTTTKTHYLNLLLQSADLTHLQIENDFLNLYLKANKEKFKSLSINSLDEIDAIFATRHLTKLGDKDDITLAHRYGVFHYTSSALVFHFNKFLRANTQFLADTAKKNGVTSEYFQNVAFYTLSTLLIVADYLKKSSLEKDTAQDKILTEKTYRIQIHTEEEANSVAIIQGIEKARKERTNTFIAKESALISTSATHIALSASVPVIDHTSKGKVIVIRFSDEYKKRIDSLSKYALEKEVILPPSDVQYTLLMEDGPFIFLDAKTINPLNTEKNNAYILQHALRYVANIVKKEFKDSKPGDIDHQIKFIGYPVIHKPNHGLAHAIRQSKIIDEILDYFLHHGNEKTKSLCRILNENENAKNLIQIAALFLSAGRENEKNSDEDPKGYLNARLAAKKNFEDYIQQYYANTLLVDDDLMKIYQYCQDVIQYLGLPEHLKNLGKQYIKSSDSNDLMHLLVYHLLTTAHLLETPRCLPLNIGQDILNQRLFADIGSILIANKDSRDDLLKLWDLSIDRIGKLGDRVLGRKNYVADIFSAASTTPDYSEKKLDYGLQKDPILVLSPSDDKNQDKSDEAIFDLIYYLFKQSKEPTLQLEYFLTKNQIHLFDSAYRYVHTKDQNLHEDKETKLISTIKENAFNKIQSLMKESNITDTDRDYKDFFIKNVSSITQENHLIEYKINYSTQSFYLASLELKHQEELKKAISDRIPLAYCSPSLREAVFNQMLLQEQSRIANTLITPYYKTLLKWAAINDTGLGINTNLDLFIKYLHHLLNLNVDQYNEISKQIDNTFYLKLIDNIRELLEKKPSRILNQEKEIEGYKINLIINEYPLKQIPHEVAKNKLLEEKDSKSIAMYQNDNRWYVLGFNSKNEIIQVELKNLNSDALKSNSLPEYAFVFFNKHLTTIENNPDALYNMGIIYEKGIWTTKDKTYSEFYFKQAEMGGHIEAQKKLRRKILFNKDELQLLQTAQKTIGNKLQAGTEVQKLAALINIYGGAYPEFFKKDEALCIEYSKKLIQFCEDQRKLLPEMEITNSVLSEYQTHLNKKRSLKKHGISVVDSKLGMFDTYPEIHLAILNREIGKLETLLEASANPNQLDSDGSPALVQAVIKRDIEAIKLLLAYGANPNKPNSYGTTPISKTMEIADWDPDRFFPKLTPEAFELQMAKERSLTKKILTVLLNYGADPYKANKSGYDAFHYCSDENHKQLLNELSTPTTHQSLTK